MIKIVAYEFRKNYLTKLMIITFIMLILINITYIFFDYLSPDYKYNYFIKYDEKDYLNFVKETHKRMDGKLTLKNVKFVKSEYNRLSKMVVDKTYDKEYQKDTYTGYVFGDYTAIETYFYKPIKYLVEYKSGVNEIVKRAEHNVKFYKKYKNKYEVEKNQYIIDNYTGRKLNYFCETMTWQKLFDYRFSDFLMICFIMFATVPIFIQEKETNMKTLILSCGKGKMVMGVSKIVSLFIFIFILVLIMSATNILFFKIIYNLQGVSIPIYSLESFANTPLNCSIGTFYIYSILMKLGGLFLLGLTISLCSLVFSKIIYPYIIGIFYIVIGLYFSGYMFSVESNRIVASIFSPFTLLKAQELYKGLLGCNIMNKFILLGNVCLVMQTLIIVILISVLYFLVQI